MIKQKKKKKKRKKKQLIPAGDLNDIEILLSEICYKQNTKIL